MAIFEIKNNTVKRIKPTEFKLEKDLQNLVEHNLETFFNCRFVASEFSTGNIHSGRIDTLAISEDNNPEFCLHRTAKKEISPFPKTKPRRN